MADEMGDAGLRVLLDARDHLVGRPGDCRAGVSARDREVAGAVALEPRVPTATPVKPAES